MAKAKASMTKTTLHSAMVNVSGGSTSSRDVVDWVKADPDGAKAIAAELTDIIDLGLMTIAGRIAAKPVSAPLGQGDLFSQGRPKEFTDLRVSEGSASGGKRVRSADITMEQWFAQPKKAARSTVNHRTSDDIVDAYFVKMKEVGLPPETTLGKYLRLD